jgi:cellulose synthase (UDP-forming)
LHWRGTVLKFASWPVFFLGFLLSVVNADIPYIPTAKKAVTGSFSPFARPLVVHCILFLFTFLFIFIKRRFFVSESVLVLSAEKVWGMMGFGFIAFLMSVGGIYAALESQRMKVEEPWSSVDINSLNKDHND